MVESTCGSPFSSFKANDRKGVEKVVKEQFSMQSSATSVADCL